MKSEIGWSYGIKIRPIREDGIEEAMSFAMDFAFQGTCVEVR